MFRNIDHSSGDGGKRKSYGGHGGDTVQQSPPKTPLKGMVIDGVWMCNCQPRLPVERLQTRKEGVNRGRW
ncbi:hypothetical protein GP486_002424, partial [Trichoglossum hirsutum]